MKLDAYEERYLIELYKKDLIKRKYTVDNAASLIYNYFNDSTGTYKNMSNIITFVGDWGSGKTTILKMIALHIQGKMGEDRKKESSPTIIYYDAWENDYSKEPILSLVREITKQSGVKIDDDYKFKSKKLIKFVTKALPMTGTVDVDELTESLLSNVNDEKDSIKQIIEYFELVSKNNQTVLFIDELDRAKPEFVVNLLENIKHYLNINNLFLVLGINLNSINHILKKYYGEKFEAIRYLDKVIGERVYLSNFSYTHYIKTKLNSYDIEKYGKSLSRFQGLKTNVIYPAICAENMGMSLREIDNFTKELYKYYEKYTNVQEYDFMTSLDEFLLFYVNIYFLAKKTLNPMLITKFIDKKESFKDELFNEFLELLARDSKIKKNIDRIYKELENCGIPGEQHKIKDLIGSEEFEDIIRYILLNYEKYIAYLDADKFYDILI